MFQNGCTQATVEENQFPEEHKMEYCPIMLVLEEAVMGQRQHPGRGFKTKDVPKLFALPRKRSCNVLNQGNAKCKNLLR